MLYFKMRLRLVEPLQMANLARVDVGRIISIFFLLCIAMVRAPFSPPTLRCVFLHPSVSILPSSQATRSPDPSQFRTVLGDERSEPNEYKCKVPFQQVFSLSLAGPDLCIPVSNTIHVKSDE